MRFVRVCQCVRRDVVWDVGGAGEALVPFKDFQARNFLVGKRWRSQRDRVYTLCCVLRGACVCCHGSCCHGTACPDGAQVIGSLAVVHYTYWSSKFDDRLALDSPRIAPHGSHICE